MLQDEKTLNYYQLIDEPSVSYFDRVIVRVRFDKKKKSESKTQPFYKSTGRNSNLPNQWLPFDGLFVKSNGVAWFDKTAYCDNYDEQFYRYGNKFYKEISDYIQQVYPKDKQIHETEDVEWINNWLDYNLNDLRFVITQPGMYQDFQLFKNDILRKVGLDLYQIENAAFRGHFKLTQEQIKSVYTCITPIL